jgi:hypothetical protein
LRRERMSVRAADFLGWRRGPGWVARKKAGWGLWQKS